MHPVSSIKRQDAGSWPLWLLFPSLITITGKSKSSHSERISELVWVHRWLSHFALCSYGDITAVIAERWPWGDGSMEMCVSVCTRDICLCVRVGLRLFKDDVWVKRLVSSWSWGLWFPSRGTCGPTCGFFSGWVKIWLLHNTHTERHTNSFRIWQTHSLTASQMFFLLPLLPPFFLPSFAHEASLTRLVSPGALLFSALPRAAVLPQWCSGRGMSNFKVLHGQRRKMSVFGWGDANTWSNKRAQKHIGPFRQG